MISADLDLQRREQPLTVVRVAKLVFEMASNDGSPSCQPIVFRANRFRVLGVVGIALSIAALQMNRVVLFSRHDMSEPEPKPLSLNDGLDGSSREWMSQAAQQT